MSTLLTGSPLGKTTTYKNQYDPTLLFPVPRSMNREKIHVTDPIPFYGCDVWNGYELSWLNKRGKPIAVYARITFPCTSENLIESKTLKLYLNSFSQTQFDDMQSVRNVIIKDLSEATKSDVDVTLFKIHDDRPFQPTQFTSTCLDDLDIDCDTYTVEPSYLTTQGDETISESVHTHLLKSNCMITDQPDWACLEITYTGKSIDHAGLLRYIVSYRTHCGFHEPCIEQIFMDILRSTKPDALTVDGRYTRRGGLDINPIRSTEPVDADYYTRLIRQ